MRISVHASGFDLTRHIRGFAETRVRSALGPFDAAVKSAAVHIEAVKGRVGPAATHCRIVVALRPSGEVRSAASHAWMNVAINKASLAAGDRVADEIQRIQLATAAPRATAGRSRAHGPKRARKDKPISHQQRGNVERPRSTRGASVTDPAGTRKLTTRR